jgi:ADP-dependent NAD(P)H-hydrate dehydratase / NAD(P)H-hydrate epimerase
MRNAHTVSQVRAAEKVLLDALPGGALMARAASGLAYAVIDFLGGAYGKRAVLLVGSGDNGGDALYAGALLARRGCAVEAVLLSDQVHAPGLAAFRAAGGRVLSEMNERSFIPATPPDVVVDGIVGIGGRPGLRENAVAALTAYAGVPVVAVDVPSGVDVDTGRLDGAHVRAAVTVTFGTHKVAHLVDPAAQVCGTVHLVDIGLDLPDAAVTSMQAADVAAMVPVPGPFDHKYTRGVVGVRAGSAAYPGAGVLCVSGASCGLAGMVRFVGEAAVADLVRAAHPETIAGAGRVQAWVVGSGGGDGAGAELAAALADGVPVVVDADGLTAVTGPLPVPAVLTPHAGELARMLEATREEVETDQLRCAREAADRFGAVVALKGRHTLVVDPEGRVRVTTTGLPWLATAGAGDVLAGVIGALLASGMDAFDAAAVGSWLHGAAARLAASNGPIVAGDVAAALPEAVRRVAVLRESDA